MRLGLRAILLIVAIVFFLLLLVVEGEDDVWLGLGLIALSAAFLVDDLNLTVGGPRRRIT